MSQASTTSNQLKPAKKWQGPFLSNPILLPELIHE